MIAVGVTHGNNAYSTTDRHAGRINQLRLARFASTLLYSTDKSVAPVHPPYSVGCTHGYNIASLCDALTARQRIRWQTSLRLRYAATSSTSARPHTHTITVLHNATTAIYRQLLHRDSKMVIFAYVLSPGRFNAGHDTSPRSGAIL